MKTKADMIDPAVLAGYNQWVGEHYEELVKKYPTRYVAVHHGKLVAVGNSYKEVREAARGQGCTEPILTMQIPTEEELTGVVSVY